MLLPSRRGIVNTALTGPVPLSTITELIVLTTPLLPSRLMTNSSCVPDVTRPRTLAVPQAVAPDIIVMPLEIVSRSFALANVMPPRLNELIVWPPAVTSPPPETSAVGPAPVRLPLEVTGANPCAP